MKEDNGWNRVKQSRGGRDSRDRQSSEVRTLLDDLVSILSGGSGNGGEW